jgi:hypothetical protein
MHSLSPMIANERKADSLSFIFLFCAGGLNENSLTK